jgi:hypothetical protein
MGYQRINGQERTFSITQKSFYLQTHRRDARVVYLAEFNTWKVQVGRTFYRFGLDVVAHMKGYVPPIATRATRRSVPAIKPEYAIAWCQALLSGKLARIERTPMLLLAAPAEPPAKPKRVRKPRAAKIATA